MRNDRPTSLRRGYGFSQARAAGAPYVAPRTGYAMEWDVNNRRYEKELSALVKREPSVIPLVQQKIEAMKKGEVWINPSHCYQTTGAWRSAATLLYYFVLYARPELAPTGYWNSIQKKFGWEAPPQSK
jgi:hypothetical protein